MLAQGRYSVDQLQKNRMTIATATAVGLMVAFLAGGLSLITMTRSLGFAAAVLGFGLVLWWLFASKKAGPVDADWHWYGFPRL